VVGERLRERIAAAPVVVGQSVHVNVTCSIGVATAESGEPSNVLLTRADVALYDAKHAGRNRVVVATPSMRTVNARP
jgi:diguanylate cyclase (GGDEF)-like protein